MIVDDGFQRASATARRFNSPGGSPSVQILTPWPHLRQPNDAPLVLSGQAFDDRSVSLTGGGLRWLLGGRLLGTGPRITASGLPAGSHRIRLVARDRFGRTGTASIVISLRASKPLFLRLEAPRKLRRAARSVRLTVASSLPATLVVRVAGLRPQRFTVGRRTQRLQVHIPRGRARLALRLSLGAGGLSRSAIISIGR